MKVDFTSSFYDTSSKICRVKRTKVWFENKNLKRILTQFQIDLIDNGVSKPVSFMSWDDMTAVFAQSVSKTAALL